MLPIVKGRNTSFIIMSEEIKEAVEGEEEKVEEEEELEK